MQLVQTPKEIDVDIIDYKFGDQNIQEIIDAFNANDDRNKMVSQQIFFVEELIKDIIKNNNHIEKSCSQVAVNYSQQLNGELIDITFNISENMILNISDLLNVTRTKVFNMCQAQMIIGEKWCTVKEAMEQGGVCYNKSTNCIFINQKVLKSNLLLAMILHEIGHARDSEFSIVDDVFLDQIETVDNQKLREIIYHHSKAERYAHAFMLNTLRQYKDLPQMNHYIKCCKKVINSTLMTYKLYYFKGLD